MNAARALVGILLVLNGSAPVWASEPAPVEPVTQDRIAPFQSWMDAWLRNTRDAQQQVREAGLSGDPDPGLQLRIDPDDESVFVGWRAGF